MRIHLVGTHKDSIDWCRLHEVPPQSRLVHYVITGEDTSFDGHYGPANVLLFTTRDWRGTEAIIYTAVAQRFTVLLPEGVLDQRRHSSPTGEGSAKGD